MPTYPLTYRIESFLKRQIAWSKNALAALDTFEKASDDEIEALLLEQKKREREAGDMAREYNGLSHEWHQMDNVDAGERESIRALSQEAQVLSELLRTRYAVAQKIANQRVQKKQEALDDLRRSRRSVTIYRPEIILSPGFIDKKA